MTALPQHVPGRTWHGRRAEGVANSFAYDVDYVLLDPDAPPPPLRLFSRGRRTLAALRDRDHGGPPGGGRGAAWTREVLVEAGLEPAPTRLLLLAQPRILGQVFNPVSFWLAYDAADALRAVIAEVTNTYGDRHSYLCHADDFSPITPRTGMAARKVLHVSPFQPVAGDYAFRFDIRPETIDIRIHYASDAGRLVATLAGPRLPPHRSRGAWHGPAARRPAGAGLDPLAGVQALVEGRSVPGPPCPARRRDLGTEPAGMSRDEGLPSYAGFAALLAAAGLPIYIHAPKFYVDEYGVTLAQLSLALFALRLVDLVQDPLLGRLAEATRVRRGAMVWGAGAVMAAGMVLLFAVEPRLPGIWWFALSLGLLFSAFSFLTIVFYAQGVTRAGTLPGGHVRLAGWRETGALLGVCLAAALPTVLAGTGAPFALYAGLFAIGTLAALLAIRPEWSAAGRGARARRAARRARRPAGAAAPAPGARQRGARGGDLDALPLLRRRPAQRAGPGGSAPPPLLPLRRRRRAALDQGSIPLGRAAEPDGRDAPLDRGLRLRTPPRVRGRGRLRLHLRGDRCCARRGPDASASALRASPRRRRTVGCRRIRSLVLREQGDAGLRRGRDLPTSRRCGAFAPEPTIPPKRFPS